MNPIKDYHENSRARIITPVAGRASESHDLLSSHHRLMEKVSPYLWVICLYGKEVCLGGSCTCLQFLLGCTVPAKEEGSTDLPYFISIHLD